jgi:putrescine importer
MDIKTCLPSTPRLYRTLTLWDLLLYGVVITSPIAALTLFGVLSVRGGGHVVTANLVAMIAMLFTAISYGRMARVYPSAGSAFSYVAQEIHPSLGYITGWAMTMDYTINPLVCIYWSAEQTHNFVPGIPAFAWRIFYVALLSWLNIQGIRASARVNFVFAMGLGVVGVTILVAAAHYLFVHPHTDPSFYTRPFYDPLTFTFGALFGSTAISILNYIGFDGISTLSEETVNPRRNIPLATVLTCLVVGTILTVLMYQAQLVWPVAEKFPDIDTAYVWVAGRTWAPLSIVIGFALLAASLGCGMTTQLGAARLLYGMGRSDALPRRFFGVVDAKHRVPRNNVIVVGAVALIGSFFVDYTLGVEILNFGALIAFMGVNAAAFIRYFVRAARKTFWNFIPPILGFFICLTLWWNLSPKAKLFGTFWMVVGIAIGVWRTRGFRTNLVFEVPDD